MPSGEFEDLFTIAEERAKNCEHCEWPHLCSYHDGFRDAIDAVMDLLEKVIVQKMVRRRWITSSFIFLTGFFVMMVLFAVLERV